MAMVRTFMTLAIAATLLNLATATSYTVGSPKGGWDANTDLQTWAASQTFLVGDKLIFRYGPSHDVIEVSQADYDSCRVTGPLQTYSDGNTVITLSSPGKRYFTCRTPGHCGTGMKLEVDALAASTPPPSASPSLPSTPIPLIPPPTIPVIPPVPSPSPEISNFLPPQSPEFAPTTYHPSLPTYHMTSPTSSPAASPFPGGSNLPPPPSPSSANKDSFYPMSLTMAISLVMVMTLLAL